jgi:hypothetical protein
LSYSTAGRAGNWTTSISPTLIASPGPFSSWKTTLAPQGCRKLRGVEGWRIRVGNRRVIYTIDDDERLVTIVAVRRRREDTYR